MTTLPAYDRVLSEFADLFRGIPSPQRPGETERQRDQRVADGLRAERYASTFKHDPIRQLSSDEE